LALSSERHENCHLVLVPSAEHSAVHGFYDNLAHMLGRKAKLALYALLPALLLPLIGRAAGICSELYRDIRITVAPSFSIKPGTPVKLELDGRIKEDAVFLGNLFDADEKLGGLAFFRPEKSEVTVFAPGKVSVNSVKGVGDLKEGRPLIQALLQNGDDCAIYGITNCLRQLRMSNATVRPSLSFLTNPTFQRELFEDLK
jgi:hypothetical protein